MGAEGTGSVCCARDHWDIFQPGSIALRVGSDESLFWSGSTDVAPGSGGGVVLGIDGPVPFQDVVLDAPATAPSLRVEVESAVNIVFGANESRPGQSQGNGCAPSTRSSLHGNEAF